MEEKTMEQQARDLLDRMGVEGAQDFTSGDLVELANLMSLKKEGTMSIKVCDGLEKLMNEKYPLSVMTLELKDVSEHTATIKVFFGTPAEPKIMEYSEYIMRKGDVFRVDGGGRAMMEWVVK